jgi:hypothetical protein
MWQTFTTFMNYLSLTLLAFVLLCRLSTTFLGLIL